MENIICIDSVEQITPELIKQWIKDGVKTVVVSKVMPIEKPDNIDVSILLRQLKTYQDDYIPTFNNRTNHKKHMYDKHAFRNNYKR